MAGRWGPRKTPGVSEGRLPECRRVSKSVAAGGAFFLDCSPFPPPGSAAEDFTREVENKATKAGGAKIGTSLVLKFGRSLQANGGCGKRRGLRDVPAAAPIGLERQTVARGRRGGDNNGGCGKRRGLRDVPAYHGGPKVADPWAMVFGPKTGFTVFILRGGGREEKRREEKEKVV
ncbi:hypothetical protein UY3_13303 [Chelonia mydas]|uniref:Uncharacterized protein n=1 Tax=Chelonia mydas TaxID=8469 RepID=M7AXU9_CHEMY|nr:hypothetical protein UY3_13303 [Chelonia mydas]